MAIFYSKSKGGFYDESIHGARLLSVVDPKYKAPEIEEGEELPEAPTLSIPNPDTLIPADAVEITDEQHKALLNAQSTGKIIKADKKGFPIAIDPPAPTDEELAVSARLMRDQLMKESDWVVIRAAEIGESVPDAWVAYRTRLRDITGQSGFPKTINWPSKPDA